MVCGVVAEADGYRGDFDDDAWLYRQGSRAAFSVAWTGASPDDFGLVWDGLKIAPGLIHAYPHAFFLDLSHHLLRSLSIFW